MTNLSDIIKERSTPGILIFDQHGRLLYSNAEAMEIISAMQTGEDSSESVLEEIYRLSGSLKKETETPDKAQGQSPPYRVLACTSGICYSLRCFRIDDHGMDDRETHNLVLIEKVIEQHDVDPEKARREFSLTKREGEVVGLICRGLTNREISEKMFIAEYTVKVHIRNIMKKMKAGSRNEIFAILK